MFYEFLSGMRKKQTINNRNVKRLAAQTRMVNRTNKLLFAIILLVASLIIVANYVPQKRKWQKLEADLVEAKKRKSTLDDLLYSQQVKVTALKSDLTLIELHARDRLNMMMPGEKIFRIEK
jgi:cell division protein FtsB